MEGARITLTLGLLERRLKEQIGENSMKRIKLSESSDAFVIKPRRFLGKELFAKIAEFVRSRGGRRRARARFHLHHTEMRRWLLER